MSKVAIFGSGLSAAYVYAACLDNNVEADFFTDRALSNQPGLGHIILRWKPSTVSLKLHHLWFFSIGSKDSYLARMNRPVTSSTTFPETGYSQEDIYNPIEFMGKMWKGNERVIFGKFSDKEIENISKNYSHSFVTFPTQASKAAGKLNHYWCYVLENVSISLPCMAIFNGLAEEHQWSRFTHYWDTMAWEYSHIEFSEEHKPTELPHPDARPIWLAALPAEAEEYASPWPAVTLVGRWARWKKGVQAFEAYEQTDKILKEL